MRPIESEIDAVSELALHVLRGTPADDIPTSSPDLYVNHVDWRQLHRWDIGEERLPPGTVVRFRELSRWERYKVYILGLVALILAQSALIGGLSVQAVRRRRAEKQARDVQAQLSASCSRIRDLNGRLIGAQEAERSRIARELHDDVSQQLGLLAIDLQLLIAGAGHRPDLGGIAQSALVRTQGLVKSVHTLSHHLHPAKLHLLGLAGAIGSLQREFSASGMTVAFKHDNVPAVVPPDLALCVYRVVQEGITNAMKHSASHYVSVLLSGSQQELIVTIADDGVGFDENAVASKGIGLVSIRERLEVLGGTLTVRSRPGRGTWLKVSVPVRPAQALQGPSTVNTGRVA